MAEEAFRRGEAAMVAEDYWESTKHFYVAALNDAHEVMKLRPDMATSYLCIGSSLCGLKNYSDAIPAFQKGLQIDPKNHDIKNWLRMAQIRGKPRLAAWHIATFTNPWQQILETLNANPTTRGFLQQADFVEMMKDIAKSPKEMMNHYLLDRRVDKAIDVLYEYPKKDRNVVAEMAKEATTFEPDLRGTIIDWEEIEILKRADRIRKERKDTTSTDAAMISEQLTKDDKEINMKKEMITRSIPQEEKVAGDTALKNKDFEKAISHYNNAMEMEQDISSLINRADAYLMTAKYDKCIKDCAEAMEMGTQEVSDDLIKMMTEKALTIKVNAIVNMNLQVYNNGNNINPASTMEKMHEAQSAKNQMEQNDCFDPVIAEQERMKGIKCQLNKKLYEAWMHYTEAIKLNPKCPKAYYNRASFCQMLGSQSSVLKMYDKCIELDPKCSEAYTYKGNALFFQMKKPHKALETYQEGLKQDPTNSELKDGVRYCVFSLLGIGRDIGTFC